MFQTPNRLCQKALKLFRISLHRNGDGDGDSHSLSVAEVQGFVEVHEHVKSRLATGNKYIATLLA